MSSRNFLFGLILIAATTLAYQPAWRGKPIWDDDLYFKSAHSSSLASIWTRPQTTQQYHPLVGTVFWIENKLWDDSMLGHHLLNILLHACSALLLFKILERLEIPGAWPTAAVFALHPVQVESVAWLVELKNTLSGFLFFSALLIYLRFDQSRSKLSYFLVLLLFLLGLSAKTIVAIFPIAILIVIWWKRGRIDWKRDLLPLVPFIAIAGVAGAITGWMERKFSGAEGAGFELSILERFLIAGRALWFYLAKLFWPADLTLIYPRWNVSPTLWWQYIFPIALILLLATAWFVRTRSRAPFAALLFFSAIVFPLLGFFNVYYFAFAFVADHFQYLASAGIITLVCGSAAALLNRASSWPRKIAYAVFIVLLIALATLTWQQSRLYQDSETMFRDVVAKNLDSPTAHNNLAGALMDRGAVDEAIVHYRKAIELKPDYQFGNYNLGAALVQKGELDEALQRLKWVLRDNPNDPRAYYTLANALSKQGNQNDAIAYYGRALRLEPDFADAHCNLANLMLERGNNSGAIEHYREALRLQPNNPQAHYNLAAGLVRNGEPDAAIAELRIALQIDPAYPDAEPLLRDLLARRKQP
jgi:protein O-mannosyl-transferase